MARTDKLIHVGIDIGAVGCRMAFLTSGNYQSLFKNLKNTLEKNFSHFFEAGKNSDFIFLLSAYERTHGEPLGTAIRLLKPIVEEIPSDFSLKFSVTGSGSKTFAEIFSVPFINEFQAIARAFNALHPEVETILEMGGDTSKYILLDKSSGGILDYEVNGECAAGTGSFIDQQASRLLYSVEEIGDIVMATEKAATIAGRCSVFAKSDMIHAQQKGFQPPQILKGLCNAVVRNFKGTIIKGKALKTPIAFIGGLAANKGIVAALRDVLDLKDGGLIVPPYFLWMEAIGSALLTHQNDNLIPANELTHRLASFSRPNQQFETMPQLQKDNLVLLREKFPTFQPLPPNKKSPVYLGIDIGSVTTKLVVVNENGNLIKGIYTKTQARPIEVVKAGLKEIDDELGSLIEIKGVGTTGSGRELIGELIGADTIKDEITAHKTGAMHIGHTITHQIVDTIFDIGGQDAKYIYIEDGIVTDFAMNEACAAGTGSFLEEQAEKLGIQIKGQFAELAFQSEAPIRLGERCTVFMEKEIIPFLQRGAKKEDIIAGLAYSIVTNYLNRVVRGRRIGEVIYFQGGTAYNDAVAAAFATVLRKKIIVPPHNGILGAIGAALLAKNQIERTKKEASSFRGFNLEQTKYRLRTFTCKGCTNFCDIQEFTVEGKKTYWGDKCSDRYRKHIKVTHKAVIPDLFELRENYLKKFEFEPRNNLPTVGIPRAMYYFDQFPLWATYFREINFNVTLSDETNRQIVNAGVETRVAEPCFPITVAHGHVDNLLHKNVNYIFIPNVIDAESPDEHTNSFFCPWGQTLCFVIRSTPRFIPHREKILSPNIHYRLGKEEVKKSFREMAKALGVSAKLSDRAVENAYEAQSRFSEFLIEHGQAAVNEIIRRNEKAVILIGRPYNIYDKMVNINIPAKLRLNYGINIIPIDFISADHIDIRDINENMFWNYGQKILRTARWTREFDNFHLIYITNFKCGPDSYIKHYVREAAEKPFLTIQFDEHGNDAGIVTRCEAYLDSKGFLQ